MTSEASKMMDMTKVHYASLSGFVRKKIKEGEKKKRERKRKEERGRGSELVSYYKENRKEWE